MLILIALLAVIYLMAWDRRPVAHYGLVLSRHWLLNALFGLGLGAAFYAAYCGLCVGLDVFRIETTRLTVPRVAAALAMACTAIPVAVFQQVLFSGYLPSTVRGRFGIVSAILAPSLLFGVIGGLSFNVALTSPIGSRLTFGMFLIAALLTTLRFWLGGIALPAGLLTGAIAMRRLLRSTYLLEFNAHSPWSHWLAPDSDPRQGLIMWAMLLTVIALGGVMLAWRGEFQLPPGQPALDISFKRTMPFSNLLGLAPLDLWLAKLREARWNVGLKYVPRLVVTLVASTVNTLLTLPERLLAPLFLTHEVPDPVFIVGVHRSGTTHLHNLLSLDERYCTPRSYQVFNPHGFLTGWLTTLALGPFLTWRRPMDSVQFTMFSPQEEEFAITAMSAHSPYWLACFPKLFAAHEKYIYPERMTPSQRASWQRQFTLFLRKITFASRKSPLLKSPYNTARVAALREMFPRAKFIHIVRHPHAVYKSNMHLAVHGWAVFQLQDADSENSFATRFLQNYVDQETAYATAAAELPASDVAEIRFEDLERDALGEIRRIYAQLELDLSPQFEERLVNYLASIAGYEKNRFTPLPEDVQERIADTMGGFARQWGYELSGELRRAA